MPINHSPLRYPGGKAALAPFLKAVLSANGLKDVAYAEPYCGGAGAALELLFSEVADSIYLNDIDPAIFSLWRTIVRDPDGLCGEIENAVLTIDEWHAQRDYYLRQRNRVGPKLAFAAFYLNRTNRSGILSARPIGGLQQDGPWKLDARFNKTALMNKVQKIARYADRIHLSQLDALEFLDQIVNPLGKRSLVYLDPPYFVQGQSLYVNHYGPDDHAAIAQFVRKKLKVPWIVSYDQHPEIERLYETCERVDYGIRYSAQARYFGRELIVLSKKLSLPEDIDPLSAGRPQSMKKARAVDPSRRAVRLPAAHQAT